MYRPRPLFHTRSSRTKKQSLLGPGAGKKGKKNLRALPGKSHFTQMSKNQVLSYEPGSEGVPGVILGCRCAPVIESRKKRSADCRLSPWQVRIREVCKPRKGRDGHSRKIRPGNPRPTGDPEEETHPGPGTQVSLPLIPTRRLGKPVLLGRRKTAPWYRASESERKTHDAKFVVRYYRGENIAETQRAA